MGTKTPEKPTNAQLVALGLSKSYASELVNGHKMPSLALAQRLEATLGYPANAWRLAGRPTPTPINPPQEAI